jgi:hypothetical protein
MEPLTIGIIVVTIILIAAILYGVAKYVYSLEKQQRSRILQQKILDDAKLIDINETNGSSLPEIVPVENRPIMSDDEIARVNINTEVPKNKVPKFLKNKIDRPNFIKLMKNKGLIKK